MITVQRNLCPQPVAPGISGFCNEVGLDYIPSLYFCLYLASEFFLGETLIKLNNACNVKQEI